MCWQLTVPNIYIKNLTSHLHTIIRTHHFDVDVRFWPISALILKTTHQSWIWRWVLSVIYAYDQFIWQIHNYYFLLSVCWTRGDHSPHGCLAPIVSCQCGNEGSEVWWGRSRKVLSQWTNLINTAPRWNAARVFKTCGRILNRVKWADTLNFVFRLSVSMP